MKLRKVLIVEDSVLQANMYKIIFAKYKCELVLTQNGQEALSQLTQKTDVDLIITDIEMPEIDGIAFLNIVKKSGLAKCPIITISTKDNLDKLKKSVELGASAYVVKPWNMSEMWTLIEKLVEPGK